MRMRICFLPKRREKSEEMVRPMAAPARGWAAAQAARGARRGGREGGRKGEREGGGARPGDCLRSRIPPRARRQAAEARGSPGAADL